MRYKHSNFTEQDQMQSHIVQHLLLLESFYGKEKTEIRLNLHQVVDRDAEANPHQSLDNHNLVAQIQ